jgi:hypothetical protein
VNRWYRAYEGTVTDAKLAEAAAVADVSRAVSIAAWHALLESAATVNNCGSYEITPRRVSVILCEPTAAVEALFAAYCEIGLIKDGVVLSWKRRQHESDSSTERTRKWREKKQRETAVCDAGDDYETSRDAPETETETEVISPNGDSPSDDEPALNVRHVFEAIQDMLRDLARPVPRDLTPERRQLIQARINQYSVEDFLTVIAKCRGSPFLRGERRNGTPLTFDWLMQKRNFQKTLEGNFD